MPVCRTLLLLAALAAPVTLAQKPPPQPAAAPALAFDVASIHLAAPSPDGHNHIWNDVHQSQFRTGNLSPRRSFSSPTPCPNRRSSADPTGSTPPCTTSTPAPTGNQEIARDSYLTMGSDAKPVVESMVMFNGELRYDVYPLANPDSVLLRPGGFWRDGSLISGHFITSSEGEFPRKLMNFFRRSVKKSFTRVQAYWVGPEALIRLRNGNRLCTAIQSPPEYDLRETGPVA
jgi:hypothetical protein